MYIYMYVYIYTYIYIYIYIYIAIFIVDGYFISYKSTINKEINKFHINQNRHHHLTSTAP